MTFSLKPPSIALSLSYSNGLIMKPCKTYLCDQEGPPRSRSLEMVVKERISD